MRDDEAIRYKKRAASVASRWIRRRERLEEIEQDVIVAVLERRQRGKPAGDMRHRVIDALRKDTGAKSLPGYQARFDVVHSLPSSSLDHPGSPGSFVASVPDRAPSPDESLDFAKHLKGLDGRDRTIAVLTMKWGFTEAEIGECLGITESRVSQVRSALFKRLKAKMKEKTYDG